MDKKELPCLKKFGFLPKAVKPTKPKKPGRQASDRYYLRDKQGVYLTTREFEISFYMATGFTVKEAAAKLALSIRTAEFYLANVRRKLSVRNKQELLRVLFDNDFFQQL